jgi:hypothetical protein
MTTHNRLDWLENEKSWRLSVNCIDSRMTVITTAHCIDSRMTVFLQHTISRAHHVVFKFLEIYIWESCLFFTVSSPSACLQHQYRALSIVLTSDIRTTTILVLFAGVSVFLIKPKTFKKMFYLSLKLLHGRWWYLSNLFAERSSTFFDTVGLNSSHSCDAETVQAPTPRSL